MHARVVTAQIQPGKMDEAVKLYLENVVPTASQLPGAKRILMLLDRAAGKVISIGLWESEDALTNSDAIFRMQVPQFASILAAPPTRETFEVAVDV